MGKLLSDSIVKPVFLIGPNKGIKCVINNAVFQRIRFYSRIRYIGRCIFHEYAKNIVGVVWKFTARMWTHEEYFRAQVYRTEMSHSWPKAPLDVCDNKYQIRLSHVALHEVGLIKIWLQSASDCTISIEACQIVWWTRGEWQSCKACEDRGTSSSQVFHLHRHKVFIFVAHNSFLLSLHYQVFFQ